MPVKQTIPYNILFAFLAIAHWGHAQTNDANIPLPNKQQVAWQQAELGVVFHYDLHVFDTSKYEQGSNRLTPVADYNIFNPQQLDVEQWVLAAKAAGAKFALITATHETGFALYQSDVNPYCMKALKWKDGRADIVKDFVDACRKQGIQPGVYLGIRWNSFFGVHDFKVDGTAEMKRKRQAYYNKMVEGMVTEICTRYGPLFEIWFDGGADDPANGAPDVLPIVKKYQPGCLFYWNAQLSEARWGGSESGTVGYPNWSNFPYPSMLTRQYPEIKKDNYYLAKHGDSSGNYFVPAMADAPLRGYNGRHEWFWEPGDEKHIYPLKDLVEMYYKSVGRNATLILGLTPDNTGLMPKPDVQRLKEFGDTIQQIFKQPIAITSGKGYSFIISLPKAQSLSQFMVQEDIAKGHRVKNFTIQVQINGKWKAVVTGSSIGNKYILVMQQSVVTKKIRLNIEAAFAEPDIKLFSVYSDVSGL